MKKLLTTHATRLLFALLCIVTGFTQSWSKTVYVYSPNYANPRIHYWGGTGGPSWNDDPTMTKVTSYGENLYSYDIGNNTSCIIRGDDQTNDITGLSGDCFIHFQNAGRADFTKQDVSPEDYTVYVKATNAPKLYAWTSTGGMKLLGNWSGTTISNTEQLADGNNWFKITFKSFGNPNIIFNYNGNQSSDKVANATTTYWEYDCNATATQVSAPVAPSNKNVTVYIYDPNHSSVSTSNSVTTGGSTFNASSVSTINGLKWQKVEVSVAASSWTGTATIASNSKTLASQTIADGGTYYYAYDKYTQTISKVTSSYEPKPDQIYIRHWSDNIGNASSVTLTTEDGVNYTASGVSIPNGNYFVFAKTELTSWNSGDNNRFSPNNGDETITGTVTKTATPGGGNAYKIGANGSWDFTFNLTSKQWTATFHYPTVYLAGDFNGWATAAMTTTDGVTYTATVNGVESGDQFKFIYGNTWCGMDGLTVSRTDCTNKHIKFNGGGNITISGTGNLSFTVNFTNLTSENTDNTFSITGWDTPEPTVKIAGSWDGWSSTPMVKQQDGSYKVTINGVSNGDTFKFIYNNNEGSGDKWYGATAGTTVTANNTNYDFLFNDGTSDQGENISIFGSGDITFTVNFNTKKFSVSGLVTPTVYTYNVYVRNTGNDVAPTLYAFDGANYTPSGINTWAGVGGTAVTNINALGKTWYHFTVTSTTNSIKVVAVAGDGHQTEDIQLSEPGTYYIAFDGSQSSSETKIPASVTTTAPEASLYLAGAFGGSSEWTQTAMTLNDGSYSVTKNSVNTGDEFQFVFKDGVDEVWYGGISSDNYGVHPDHCSNIALTDGTGGNNRANFRVIDGYGNLTFTVPENLATVTITGWTETSNQFTIYVRSSWAPYAHVFYTRVGNDYVLNEGFNEGKAVLTTTETLVDGKSWYKLQVTAPTPTIKVIFTDGTQSDGSNNQTVTITQSNLTEYYIYNYVDDNNTQANVGNKDYRLGVIPLIGKDLYLIGKANGHGWAPNNGLKMERNGHVYTIENVQLTKASDQDGFAFASVLAETNDIENWVDVVNPFRLMSHLEHGDAIDEAALGEKHSIERYHEDHRNWRMDLNGRFNITVDLDNEYIKVERAHEALYMMGTYHYGGKDYTFRPSDAAEMQTADGKIYTLSGVTLDYTVDGNDVIHGNTFQFIKELTTDDAAEAYAYLQTNKLRMGADGAVKKITDDDINVALPAATFDENTDYYDFEMNTRGKFMVIVNLTDAANPTVTLRPMASGSNEMTVHLEKTDNVANPTIVAWDKLRTDPSNNDFASSDGNFNHVNKVSERSEITTADGRQWYTWTIQNAIADFYFTRTNGSVTQSETLWRRAGNVYYTWPKLNDDDTEDETREYTSVSAPGVPDCAQMLEDHYYAYFINTPGWKQVFCHAWNGSGDMLPKSDDPNYEHHNQYPGVVCELVGYDSEGYEVWRFDFTEYFGGNGNFVEPTGIIFNNGVDDKVNGINKDYSTNPPTETDENKEQSGDFVYDNGAVFDYLGMLVTGNSLGNLIVKGIIEGPEYSIDSNLEVVYFDRDAEETIGEHRIYGALYCKDSGEFYSTPLVEKSQIQSGEIDYMMTKTHLMDGHSRYDQSNWIKLTLSTRYFTDHNNGVEMTKTQQLELLGQYENKILPAGEVKGQLMNNVNPAFHVLDLPNVNDCKPGSYATAPNVMIPANFVGTQNCKETEYGHNGSNRYFFVTPKPYEFIHITWAVYENNAFYVPSRVYMNTGDYPQYFNEGDLDGYFKVEWDMLESEATPTNGEVYQFDAIVTLDETKVSMPHNAPSRSTSHKGAAANKYEYIVKPLNISGSGAIITAVKDVETVKTVTTVRYYNVAGVESDKPFDGLNIIVTEYNDGTKTTSKQLR